MSITIADIPDGHIDAADVQAVGAGSASTSFTIFRAPFACYVTSIVQIAGSDITGADTNTRHYNLINTGTDGSGTAELAATDYVSGTDENGGSPRAIYSPASPGLSLASGVCLTIQSELVGTGQTIGPMRYETAYRKR